jgi:Fic family protein
MRQVPVWTTQHSAVSLTIYRASEPKAEVQLSQRQQTFLETAQPGEAYNTSDYAEMTGVVVSQAERELSELLERGFLQRRGKGRATVYVRTDLSP